MLQLLASGAVVEVIDDSERAGSRYTGRDIDAVVVFPEKSNSESLSNDAFRQHNVAPLERIAAMAKNARIPRLVYISTIHLFDDTKDSPYLVSRKEAEDYLTGLSEQGVIDVSIIRVGSVYGEQFSGKLSVLEKFPRPILHHALNLMRSARPTSSVKCVVSAILAAIVVKRTGMVVATDTQADNPIYAIEKRGVDISFALVIILGFWWLLLLVWLSIKLTTRGPGIFRQVRVGQNKHPFTCYKFRTMRHGTVQVGTHLVGKDAITFVGSIIRKTKLDELPQVINLLRNELSLVGPRPCLPNQIDLIAARECLGVFDIKPGITGYAQVQGVDMSDPELLARIDAEYVSLESLKLDGKILISTAIGCGFRDRADFVRLESRGDSHSA